MRIAIFSQIRSPWTRKFISRLIEQGHEIHLIDFQYYNGSAYYTHALDETCAEEILYLKNRLTYHVIGNKLSTGKLVYFIYALKLRKIVKQIQADILLSLWGGGWGTMCYLSGVRPYAIYLVGGDVVRAKGFEKWLGHLATKNAAIVYVNGKYLSEKATEYFPDANIYPLYLGIDTQRFVPGNPPNCPIKIICTRGFQEVYNNRYLIESIAELPEGLPYFTITFTSPGPLRDEIIQFAYNTLPQELFNRIEFLKGVSEENMIENLKNSHIYCSLSRSDGASISLFEAYSCGLFPILSDIPPNREWIDQKEENGLLVPLDQPKKLAEALVLAITNESLRLSAREKNRNLIISQADNDKTIKDLVEKLQKYVK